MPKEREEKLDREWFRDQVPHPLRIGMTRTSHSTFFVCSGIFFIAPEVSFLFRKMRDCQVVIFFVPS